MQAQTQSQPRTTLRPATLADADAIVDILCSSADWYEPIIDPGDLDQHCVSRSWYTKNFERRRFFALELNKETVGTLTLQDAGPVLYLGYVYLHVDHVGQGLGRRLLDFARQEARRLGKRGLVLLAHPEAEWAVKAYLRYGFELLHSDREQVLEWNDGWMEPYYEEGFSLFFYDLGAGDSAEA